MTFLSNYWHVLLLTTSATIVLCYCVEEDQAEVFLPPRNFNPHPYETGYDQQRRTSGNTGPVLFPETPPEPPSGGVDAYTSGGDETYTNVANKRKFLYQNQDEKNYVFSYKVLDHRSGDDYSHRQSQDGRATKGEYRVKLPDGRVQIVSYTADKNGYNARVTYEESYSQDKHRLYHQQKFSQLFQPSPTPTTTFENHHGEDKNIGQNEVDYITVTEKPYYKLNSYGAENYVGFVSSTAAPVLGDYTHFSVAPKYDYL